MNFIKIKIIGKFILTGSLLIGGCYYKNKNQLLCKNYKFQNAENLFENSKNNIFKILDYDNKIITCGVYMDKYVVCYISDEDLKDKFGTEEIKKIEIIAENIFNSKQIRLRLREYVKTDNLAIFELLNNLDYEGFNLENKREVTRIAEKLLLTGITQENKLDLKEHLITQKNLLINDYQFLIDRTNKKNNSNFKVALDFNGDFKGFMIPNTSDLINADHIINIVKRVKYFSKVERTYLGASFITSKNSEKEKNGILIVKISPNSPAYLSGLELGDVITEINGIKIKDINDFVKVISFWQNIQLPISVIKNGEIQNKLLILK
jgi:hypothetical protein